MQNVLKQVAAVTGVVGVYSYDVSYATIPLVIVNKKIARKELKAYDVRGNGSIILTKKDIEQGKDVFSLRFAHMQQHATLVAGKDVLGKISLKQKHIIRALEAMLRVTLIDLREMMVKGEFMGGQQLAITLERIQEYLHLVKYEGSDHKKDFKKSEELCQKDTMKYKDVLFVYTLFETITKQIDTL